MNHPSSCSSHRSLWRITGNRKAEFSTVFRYAVGRIVPHMLPEAEAHIRTTLGDVLVSDDASTGGCIPVSIVDRVRAHAKALLAATKGRPISTVLDLRVDGEFPKLVGKVWREYIKASAQEALMEASTCTLVMKEDGVRLAWNTGHFRLARQVFLPDIVAEFSGRMVIDMSLLNKGGPYRVDIGQGGLRYFAMDQYVSKWKIVRSLLRKEYGGFVSRKSLKYAEVIGRMRAGANLSFAAEVSRYSRNIATKVTLTGGRLPADVITRLRSNSDLLAKRADEILAKQASFKNWIESLATDFAAMKGVEVENSRRELEVATETFRESAGRLHSVMREVCYKTDVPAEPYSRPPERLPVAKSVSGGLLSKYRGTSGSFADAWQRVVDAVAKVPGTELPGDDGMLPTRIGRKGQVEISIA